MIEQIKSSRFITLSLLVLLAACTRALPLLIPSIGNFTAIGALAIFAGSQFSNNRFAFTIPLLALAISDWFIGNGFNILVYVGFIVMVACGTFIRNRVSVTSVALSSMGSAVAFYLITNFAYFYSPNLYPHNFTGVLTSYAVALPFLRNMLIGDLFYGFVLFGILLLRNTYCEKKSVLVS